MTEKNWRGMSFILWPLYSSNVCHRILGFVLLWCSAGEVSSKVLWPSGRYGLPMPTTGCPNANGFHWNSGYIFQDLENTDSLTSVSPNPSHLRGWVSNDVVRYFCVKDNASAAVDSKRFRWPAGEYCIYRRGSKCPKGLLSGWVLWDDENSATGTNKNRHAGVLPAGVYNQDTKIYFCCQTTGSYDNPIELPVASPFYLIAFTTQCQEVLNTIHTMEHITYDTEDHNNHDQKSFPYPYGVSFQEPTIYYCYYKECAWTMTALRGTFWSPNYPLDYKNHASCKWHITVPSNYIISVDFEDVILERTCCRCDYVEVWETLKNGSAVLIATFCDETKPDPSQQFISTGNNVMIVFRSDATVHEKGFRASYRAIPLPAVTTTSIASTKQNDSTAVVTMSSTIASTADTPRTTTTSSHVTTTPKTNTGTTSRITTTLSVKKNDTTTISFRNTSTRAFTTTRDTTALSSEVATEPSTTEFTSEKRLPPTEYGKSTATNRDGVKEARNESASNGIVSVIIGVIASLIVIGGAVAGALFWFYKKRNIQRSHNNGSTPAVNFTSAEKAVDISSNSSWNIYEGSVAIESDNPLYESNIERSHNNGSTLAVSFTSAEKTVDNMYEGSVAIDTVNESDNPLYERDCLENSAKDGFNDEIKESENPLYASRDCLENSAKDGFNDEIKESENPLYASSVETVKESDNPMYESMDDALKGPVHDDIYSLVYERMI